MSKDGMHITDKVDFHIARMERNDAVDFRLQYKIIDSNGNVYLDCLDLYEAKEFLSKIVSLESSFYKDKQNYKFE